MPAFTAHAPGKIILFGEHAVVYGRPALAAPVTQVKATATVMATPQANPGVVHIQAPNIGLEADLVELPEGHPLVKTIQLMKNYLSLQKLPAFSVRITSTIPVASGLGSGAAVSVALLRALSAFFGRPLSDDEVCALAFEVEKVYHGTPSGIDNTVITYARPVYFMRNHPIETLRVARPFMLVIGDSGISSPTSLAVGDVRQAWQAHPDQYEALFNQIGSIAQTARVALEEGQATTLGEMMNANHKLLQKIGVSSTELDRLVQVALQAGASGAKLSGGGRGGNMIALVDATHGPQVKESLLQAGARQVILTTIG